MTEFENLKKSYVCTIQWGMLAKVDYHEAKCGNEVLCEFCKNLVEKSIYHDSEKAAMKCELELLKEMLSLEIDSSYR